MISVTFLHPYVENAVFNMDYYVNNHLVWVAKCCGDKLVALNVHQGISGLAPNTPPAYFVIAEVFFETEEDMKTLKENMPKFAEDRPNYTTGKPIIQVSKHQSIK